jgi:hypothetical protein
MPPPHWLLRAHLILPALTAAPSDASPRSLLGHLTLVRNRPHSSERNPPRCQTRSVTTFILD